MPHRPHGGFGQPSYEDIGRDYVRRNRKPSPSDKTAQK
jgi:hypothetical protein